MNKILFYSKKKEKKRKREEEGEEEEGRKKPQGFLAADPTQGARRDERWALAQPFSSGLQPPAPRGPTPAWAALRTLLSPSSSGPRPGMRCPPPPPTPVWSPLPLPPASSLPTRSALTHCRVSSPPANSRLPLPVSVSRDLKKLVSPCQTDSRGSRCPYV